ncbi:MAG: hypothetical protein RJA98_2442 [Pseudomonadota bacterium]|jgi:hypothetical protein
MKTTLDIDDLLISRAKALAARERTTLTRVVEEGLSLRLRSPRRAARAGLPELPVYAGRGGLRAGIDPTSNRAMLAAAEDGSDDDA